MEIHIATNVQDLVNHILRNRQVECSPEQFRSEVKQLFDHALQEIKESRMPEPNIIEALRSILSGGLPIN